ncbi:DUF6766 family protein [Arthrobacter sp. ATA002]|uniref:DUF6766 family protein n=1 Tax=Arthrobacter sp. ATA002 TaxID=2991715 RepID=UPI002E2FAA51|nr:DUF6766 family protein [Arthrobacter sp. ATA002]
MVILSVYLRQHRSPESKPVGEPHDATNVEGKDPPLPPHLCPALPCSALAGYRGRAVTSPKAAVPQAWGKGQP